MNEFLLALWLSPQFFFFFFDQTQMFLNGCMRAVQRDIIILFDFHHFKAQLAVTKSDHNYEFDDAINITFSAPPCNLRNIIMHPRKSLATCI